MSRWWGITVVLILASLLVRTAGASLFEPFSGYADVSAVQSTVDELDRESLRQDYNVIFQHRLVPYVDLRLAYRYYDFDQDFVDLVTGSYRKEKQPSGELRWNHPLFLASGSIFRREVETTAQQPLVTNSAQYVLKSKDTDYPVVEFRYDEQHTYFPEDPAEKDIRNKRLLAGVVYDPGVHHLAYTFTRDVSENVVTDLTSNSRRHAFRWSASDRVGSRQQTQLSGNYNFGHTTALAEVAGGGPVLRILPILRGLYALDDTPNLGVLEPRTGLADGNTTAPVVPLIDIGGSSTDHNLGADLGTIHDVGGMYIYTDRPSGPDVSWSVWGSSDNLAWTQVAVAPQQSFNQALNRYEITLPVAFAYRYVKAVNSGPNAIAQVYITEINVLEQVTDKSETELQFVSHRADGRVGYRFNERWQAALDAAMTVEENPGRAGDRAGVTAGARVNWEPSETITHNFNWQGFHQLNENVENLTENTLGYTLVANPLETLRGSFTISDRYGWIDQASSFHNLSGAVEANADLLADLQASVAATVAGVEDFRGDRAYRTWSVRARLDAGLTRSFDIFLDGLYQESLETSLDDLSVRTATGVGVDWRVTRDIYVRGTYRVSRDNTSRGIFEGLVSWNILPSLRVSAQHYEIVSETLTTTLRQSVNLNWELSSRANVYLRLTKVDLSGSGGTRTTSFQQGFRIGF